MKDMIVDTEAINTYKLACQNYSLFFSTERKGKPGSPEAVARAQKVVSERKRFGNGSLYYACSHQFEEGYAILVQTLGNLSNNKVHTINGLLAFDIESAQRHNKNFGPKKAELAGLLKEVFIAQNALYSGRS